MPDEPKTFTNKTERNACYGGWLFCLVLTTIVCFLTWLLAFWLDPPPPPDDFDLGKGMFGLLVCLIVFEVSLVSWFLVTPIFCWSVVESALKDKGKEIEVTKGMFFLAYGGCIICIVLLFSLFVYLAFEPMPTSYIPAIPGFAPLFVCVFHVPLAYHWSRYRWYTGKWFP